MGMKLTLIMTPAKGIFKQAVAPYKKGLQQVYMSSDLVIDGQTCKLVGIYPVSVWLRMETNFEQFAVVDRAGNYSSLSRAKHGEEPGRLCEMP
jgi:hypothetical protein